MATFTNTLDIGYGHYLQLIFTETSHDIKTNQTTLTYRVDFCCGSQQYWSYNYNNQIWLTINGQVLYADTYVGPIILSVGQTQTILSGTVTVTHNSDGSKTMGSYMRFTQIYGSPGSYDAQATFSNTLTRIYRGIVEISNGSSFSEYQTYIYDSDGWSLYQPYIYNGSSWDLY